ncbi:hypothetical protein QBC34DRAFT_73528 [Podospora aff. communis PSN243]|uniref:HIT-type domain-containing protein n=1 Tax=Podospora aff. communis PSN243 TaxID=3040156 RepID=A0AAV9H7E8_9PEZI|nr:hypothetical protein QBC34DRAFT_73528 [Podospora aff. communis PSN243]
MSLFQGDDGSVPPVAVADKLPPPPADAPHTEAAPVEPVAKEDDVAPPPPKPDPKLCGICNKEPGKYKCPQCFMPYCSIPCSRIHKANHPPPSSPTTKPSQPPPTTVPQNPDPYQVLLDHQSELTRLFRKYPFLQQELSQIQKITLPPEPNGTTNGLPPSFTQPPGKKTHTWSREAGLRQGAAALRKARTDPTDRGDGIREFCDLVLYLLSAKKREDAKAKDLTEVVREEVVAEETKIIERLLQEEAGEDGEK